MLDAQTIAFYLPVVVAVVLAPGGDTLFVVSSALRLGPRGGLVGTAGTISGGAVHIGFSALGISELLVHSALAFSVLKLLGAAYLLFLGIRTLLSTERSAKSHSDVTARNESTMYTGSGAKSMSILYIQGLLTNVLNPKVALFALSFLPQFVSPNRGHIWIQVVELGAIWYGAGLVWLSLVSIAAWRAQRFITQGNAIRRVFKYSIGALFIALGARVALSTR
jgi:threonine/homoserine/homoserine lactone efflux protein